jgi:hypothetical protein
MASLRGQIRHALLGVVAFVALTAGCGQSTEPSRANHQPTTGEIEPPQAAPRYDLAGDENRGGHTLSKHVGRTDAQLRERLERERNISAASTWTDRDTAETTIAAALSAERGRIENWMRRGMPRANLALHYNAGHVIGRSLRRGDNHTVDGTRAVIVLRAAGPDRFYVLTAYPEAGE